MKKLLILTMMLFAFAASSIAQCSVTQTIGTPPSPNGFCIHYTVGRLSTGTYAGLYEIQFVNPNSTDTVRIPEAGLWQGAGGDGCYDASFDQQYTLFAGIKSGAKVRARSLNYYIGEYALYTAVWPTVKDDPSKWCAWSNTVTVTFSTPTPSSTAKGKKK